MNMRADPPQPDNLSLKRVILHNSAFRGKTTQICLEGHTNVGGGNGAGKTTTLNVIPTFYGTEPNKLVPTGAAGKSNFIDFYLPEQSSAIFFEYLRDDGLRLAMAYRNPSSKMVYRFISAGAEIFEMEAVQACLSAGETIPKLIELLKSAGIAVSKAIDTIIDYRAIIQNDKELINRRSGVERRQLTQLAQQYCLGGAGTHIRSMDALSFSVLKRTAMFDRFKETIADTQFNEIHLSMPDLMKDKSIMQDIEAVRDFASTEARLRKCIESHHQRVHLEAVLKETLAHLKESLLASIDRREHLEDLLSDLQRRINERKANFDVEERRIKGEIADVDSQIERLERELDDIQSTYDRFQAQDIDQLIANYNRLSEIQTELSDAEDTYKQCTERVKDIERERESAIATAKSRKDAVIDRCRAERDAQQQAKETRSDKYHAQTTALTNKRREDENRFRNRAQQDENVLRESLASLKTRLVVSGFAPEDQSKLESIEERITAGETEARHHQNTLTGLDQQLEQLGHELADADARLAETKDNIERLQSRKAEKLRLISPDPNSLIALARTHQPEWVNRLGKILPLEVLQRTDLSPRFDVDAPDTVLGWSLEIDKLQRPDYAADITELETEIAQLDLKLANENRLLNDRELSVKKQLEEQKSLKAQQAKETAKLNTFKVKLERTKEELSDARAEAKARLEMFKIELTSTISAKERELKSHQQSVKAGLDEIAENFGEAQNELKGQYDTEVHRFEREIERIDEEMRHAECAFKQATGKIDTQIEQRQREEGVDPEIIRNAREKCDHLDAQVRAIKASHTIIEDYKHFTRVRWSTVEHKTLENSSLKGTLHKLKEELKRLQKDFYEENTTDNKQVSDYISSISSLRKSIDEAQRILDEFAEINAPKTPCTSDLTQLTSDAKDQRKQELKARENVRSGVRQAKEIIYRYTHSKVYNAWDYLLKQRMESTGLDESDDALILQQPLDIETLLDTEVPAIRASLVEDIRTIGDALSKQYDLFNGLNKDVARVSRTLATKINTVNPFDELSNLEFELSSLILEADYWVYLERFNTAWSDWRETRSAMLPPEQTLEALYAASEAMRNAKVGKDINSLLRLTIRLDENGRRAVIRNANDLENASSNGLSYLAILVLFVGMTRYLCPNHDVKLHWAVDEFAAISLENIAKVFEMFDAAGIYVFSAFPTSDPNILQHYDQKLMVNLKQGVKQFFSSSEELENKLLAHKDSIKVEEV